MTNKRITVSNAISGIGFDLVEDAYEAKTDTRKKTLALASLAAAVFLILSVGALLIFHRADKKPDVPPVDGTEETATEYTYMKTYLIGNSQSGSEGEIERKGFYQYLQYEDPDLKGTSRTITFDGKDYVCKYQVTVPQIKLTIVRDRYISEEGCSFLVDRQTGKPTSVNFYYGAPRPESTGTPISEEEARRLADAALEKHVGSLQGYSCSGLSGSASYRSYSFHYGKLIRGIELYECLSASVSFSGEIVSMSFAAKGAFDSYDVEKIISELDLEEIDAACAQKIQGYFKQIPSYIGNEIRKECTERTLAFSPDGKLCLFSQYDCQADFTYTEDDGTVVADTIGRAYEFVTYLE